MSLEQEPLPASTQWNEARGFERLYGKNPDRQAAFIKTLLGFRQTSIEFKHPDADGLIAVDAINETVRRFTQAYPECLEVSYQLDSELGGGVYHADPRLVEMVQEITVPDE